jgi:hypothetical protein
MTTIPIRTVGHVGPAGNRDAIPGLDEDCSFMIPEDCLLQKSSVKRENKDRRGILAEPSNDRNESSNDHKRKRVTGVIRAFPRLDQPEIRRPQKPAPEAGIGALRLW